MPLDPILARLSPPVRTACRPLVGRPLQSVATLRAAVEAHAARAEQASGDLIDRPLARLIADGLLRLLGADLDEDQRRAVQLACDYFISDEDAESDLTSPLGFEDDAEVFNAVAAVLGFDDAVIPLD
ncbi:MAG: hypothetical protein RIT81_17805 [Deltaproteobacteria bacterium]